MKPKKKPKVGKEPKHDSSAPDKPAQVTNKTVEQHRDEVIGKARKYIYPTHTKRHIVVVSTSILVGSIIVFLIICGFLLYKFQNSSTFIYRVTQVVPFPVAKAGDRYVGYENYLFEIRHYKHYYQYRSRLPVNFDSDSGQDQLSHYKHQALDEVVNYAYAKQLAKKYNITVSSEDVDKKLADIRQRGLLGRDQQQLADVLEQTFGWSIGDARREIKQKLLLSKLSFRLDIDARNRAESVLAKLNHGAKFAKLAKKYSVDKPTADMGGKYPIMTDLKSRDLPPEMIATAFKLKKGQHSEIINTGYSLEIIKLLDKKGDKLQLAHIQIKLQPASHYIEPLKKDNPPTYYIDLPKAKN